MANSSHCSGRPSDDQPPLPGGGGPPDGAPLAELLAHLEAQRRTLQRSQLREEARREAVARRAASSKAGKFVPGTPWLRPSAAPHLLAEAGHLPTAYLSTRETENATRPIRSYAPPATPLWRETDIWPRAFEKEDPLHLPGVEEHQNRRSGTAVAAAGAGVAKSLPALEAKIAGLQLSQTAPVWARGKSTPRTFDYARYLHETHPVASARGAQAAVATSSPQAKGAATAR